MFFLFIEFILFVKKLVRFFIVVVVNCWKLIFLVVYSGSEWLVVNLDKGGYVVSLNCFICKMYVDIIKGMKNFLVVLVFNGLINFCISNVEDYVWGEFYRKGLDFYLKDGKGLNVFERVEVMKFFYNVA